VIGGLFLILAMQLLGEFIARLTGIPVPGPVVGMVLFFVYLLIRNPREDSGVVKMADSLLSKMALFFVPAGAAVGLYLSQLASEWVAVVVGLMVSWAVTLVVAGFLASWLRPRRVRKVDL
jgi:holin-like protein